MVLQVMWAMLMTCPWHCRRCSGLCRFACTVEGLWLSRLSKGGGDSWGTGKGNCGAYFFLLVCMAWVRSGRFPSTKATMKIPKNLLEISFFRRRIS